MREHTSDDTNERLHKCLCNRRLNRRAFTLIEILLVVVIIGILAGMVAVRLTGRAEDARVTRAKADLGGTLSTALDLFEQDTGRYPTTEEGLTALVENPGIPGWKGSYLKGGLKNDPWDTPYGYQYLAEEKSYRVFSSGPDRQVGTEDDIYP